jgi:hypothetical protein
MVFKILKKFDIHIAPAKSRMLKLPAIGRKQQGILPGI